MDERRVQVDWWSSRKSLGETRSTGVWGLETAGGREHEMLVAEGHYRCPCCRRADIDEKNVVARRMR
jgi:hypothetical protein